MRSARQYLQDLEMPSSTPADVQVVLGRLDETLSHASHSLTNVVSDLRDIQPTAFDTDLNNGRPGR